MLQNKKNNTGKNEIKLFLFVDDFMYRKKKIFMKAPRTNKRVEQVHRI